MEHCNGEGCDLHSSGQENSCLSRENVSTSNLKYGYSSNGEYLVNNSCRSQCIEAHENLIRVADFIQNTLQHKWGKEDWEHKNFLSNINCKNKQWDRAYWKKDQAFFGQHRNGEKLISLATSLDIVTHEFFHGVSEQIVDLPYTKESGALDESYCDIFAILLVNSHESDISKWQWEIGRGFGNNGEAVRDLSEPEKFDQPGKIKDSRDSLALRNGMVPREKSRKFDAMHYYSGIHNKAAYKLLVSKDSEDQYYLFNAASGARLFYLALNRLPKTSSFKNSYFEIKKAAKSLFRNDTDKQDKLDAIDNAFTIVGII